jgi:DNA-binding NtrC family response regulator
MGPTISILVIDDEQIVLDSVKMQLRDEDYTIHAVLSAQEGLALIEGTHVDIVLTDLMMPHTDGLELMRLIQGRFPDMPVIVMTGYATVSTATQAVQAGAFGYVAKPFTRAELKEVVSKAAAEVQKHEGD